MMGVQGQGAGRRYGKRRGEREVARRAGDGRGAGQRRGLIPGEARGVCSGDGQRQRRIPNIADEITRRAGMENGAHQRRLTGEGCGLDDRSNGDAQPSKIAGGGQRLMFVVGQTAGPRIDEWAG